LMLAEVNRRLNFSHRLARLLNFEDVVYAKLHKIVLSIM